MVKRGVGRGRGNSLAGSGAQATGTSTKDESTNKQEEELLKNITKEPVRKIKEKEKSAVDSPALMSTRARTANEKNKSELNSAEHTHDKKIIHQIQENASSESMQCKTKRKELNSIFTVTPKAKSPISSDAIGYEILSGKPRYSSKKELMACVSPLSDENKYSQISDLRRVSNRKTITKTKANLHPTSSKLMEALSIGKKDTKTTSVVDKSLPKMQYSKETDETGLNIDTRSSEVEHDSSTEKKKCIEFKSRGIEGTSILQYPNEFDDTKLNLGRKHLNVKPKLSLEKENKVIEAKTNVDEFTPMLQFSQDIDERKLNLRSSKLKRGKTSEMQKESESKCEGNKFMTQLQCSEDIDEQRKLSLKSSKLKKQSSETEKSGFELKGEESKFSPVLQCSTDIDYRKINFDLKALKIQEELPVENEITASKLEVDQSMLVSLDSKLQEANKKLQNIDINASITIKQDVSSENRKILKPKNEKYEKIINLRENVNIRFESDTRDVKTVLVDNQDRYISDKNEKMTFNIGDGYVQLSFIDNKVCIFSQSGEIDCSIRKNQLIISLKDSLIQSVSSPEDPSITELPFIKDTEICKDFRTTKHSQDKSKEIQQEQESENSHKLTLKADSPLVPNSLVQRRVLNTAENFLTRIASSCEDFEIEFLDSLKKRNNKIGQK